MALKNYRNFYSLAELNELQLISCLNLVCIWEIIWESSIFLIIFCHLLFISLHFYFCLSSWELKKWTPGDEKCLTPWLHPWPPQNASHCLHLVLDHSFSHRTVWLHLCTYCFFCSKSPSPSPGAWCAGLAQAVPAGGPLRPLGLTCEHSAPQVLLSLVFSYLPNP